MWARTCELGVQCIKLAPTAPQEVGMLQEEVDNAATRAEREAKEAIGQPPAKRLRSQKVHVRGHCVTAIVYT